MKRLLASLTLSVLAACPLFVGAAEPSPAAKTEVKVEEKLAKGDQAPAFTIKDSNGKVIDLAELTAKGPVLVRLTCGCSGCDKELAYFQELHNAYASKGLTSLAIFKEPDTKVAKYVEEKKLNMLYAVDSKGESWSVFKTKTMPTNFLIDKGGKIISVASGCDPSGLLANALSKEAAGLVNSTKVDVKAKVTAQQK
jgi:peroxiredoxin